jgi:hypothetical protein
MKTLILMRKESIKKVPKRQNQLLRTLITKLEGNLFHAVFVLIAFK